MKSPLILAAGWLLLAMTLPAHAQTAKKTPPAPRAAPPVSNAAQPAAAKPSLGPIANYAAQQGVRQCLGRIDQVSNFLTNGATSSGAAVFIPPREPDRGLASVSLEVLGGNGLSYVNTAYAPSSAGCDGVYEAITYWAAPCEQVAPTFQGFTGGKPIRQHIQSLDGGPNAKVYLMPAGQGCISIKKEVVY